jgi:Zn-dependent protease with chaperone function
MHDFSSQEVARARRYHRPLYVALGVDVVLALAVPAALLPLDLPLPWWAEVMAGPAIVVACGWAVGLVTAWWRLRHERAWGFSTQTTRGWWTDRLRGLAVGLAAAVVSVGGLLALAHLFPRGWPWLAAAGGAGLALLLSFVAPVVLEPVFNRFRPLEGELATRLHATAERAGVPVRDVLVADASRRTRKQNAYVSGLGRTRRVVLWDTLLEAPPSEVELVVAHELGHRKLHHVLQGTLLAMTAPVLSVLVLRAITPRPDPSDAALVVLVGTAVHLALLPFGTAFSRRCERAADRFSLVLVPDLAEFEGLMRRLATANLADLTPPRWLYYAVFTHPTPPERLRNARLVFDRLHS